MYLSDVQRRCDSTAILVLKNYYKSNGACEKRNEEDVWTLRDSWVIFLPLISVEQYHNNDDVHMYEKNGFARIFKNLTDTDLVENNFVSSK